MEAAVWNTVLKKNPAERMLLLPAAKHFIASCSVFRCELRLKIGFIAAFTLRPLLVLIYFYSSLPDKMPEYLNQIRGVGDE